MAPCTTFSGLKGMAIEVRIAGAGVAGLCVATEIARRGGRVSLVDLHPCPGPHSCSWWAGGMLAPDCEGESAEEPVVRLGREAADWWQERTGIVKRNGTLVVALSRDAGELRRFARRTQGHEEVDADGIEALEPDLAGRCRNALYFSGEAHVAPRAALGALVKRLADQGISVETAGADERGATADRGSAGRTEIDCRGLAAADTLPDLRGVKGEMLLLRCPDLALSRPIRLLHPRFPLYVVPHGNDTYMLGATMIEATERTRITARSLLELLSAAYALHPAFGEAEVLEIGVDARPAFPDNLPRIQCRHGAIHVNGLFRHGFLLAPAVGRMVAELLFDGRIPEVMHEPVSEWRTHGSPGDRSRGATA